MQKQVQALKRRFIVSLMISVFVSLLISYFIFYQQFDAKQDQVKNLQEESLLRAYNTFNRELGSIRQLMTLLLSDHALKNVAGEPVTLVSKDQNDSIVQHFIDFGTATENISQIRWLDTQGQERVRVNFDAHGYEVVPQNKLQNKASRYYFEQGMLVSAPNIYTSALDLNVEHHVIVKPYQPTLRATYRTGGADYLLDGLMVVNFNLSGLFSRLEQFSLPAAHINILNSEGFWLLHTDKSKEWSFLLKPNAQSIEQLSPVLWQSLASQPIEKVGYFAHKKINSFIKMQMYGDSASQAQANYLILLVSSDEKILLDAFFSAAKKTLMTLMLLLSILGIYLLREYQYKVNILKSGINLQQEQQALMIANEKLNQNLQLQQQLQEELVEAQKLSSLGMMVAGIAHEMNTPVGGAVISTSNAQVICQKLQDQIQKGLTKQYLDESLASINDNLYLSRLNLDKAVMHIKSFKRMAIDRANEQLVSCDMSKIVDDLFAVLHPRFKTSRVALNKHIETDSKLVSRPGIISQLIENLVLNALDHAFNEGEVGQIDVRVFNVDIKTICITVSDNGKGIHPDLQDKLFEPFVTSSRNRGHTGLGLSMVKQWATKILQGQITLKEKADLPDEISTQFEIILPLNIRSL